MAKEQQTDDVDDNKVKSYLLKGEKTIGYISLPSFYEDWEDKNSVNGCSNDVAKEILKLKKEKGKTTVERKTKKEQKIEKKERPPIID